MVVTDVTDVTYLHAITAFQSHLGTVHIDDLV